MYAKIIMIIASFAVLESAKILVVVPTPSISHQIVFHTLIRELINRNHEVTAITTDPVFLPGKSPINYSEIDLHDLSYGLWQKVYSAVAKIFYENDVVSVMRFVFGLLSNVFEEQLKDKAVLKLISNKKISFDLLILEECANPALIFSHIFKAPVIVMSSFGASNRMNVISTLAHPLLYPTHLHRRIYNLTIWESISELYRHLALDHMFQNLEFRDNKILQSTFGIDTPPLCEMKDNVHMMFLNIHPILLHYEPGTPNLIYTWGIHKAPEKLLPKDLQSYLDSSKNGVIYMSFGTNFNTKFMSPETLQIFLQVFSRLNYNILWKWDTDELPGKSENIKTSKWFPQYAVLRHPNLKLFITQGGLQSTDEAINAGVPLIGLPMFSDQNYNTEKYMYFNIGIQLHFKSLTVANLENAINNIFTNYNSYKRNITKLRKLMHDQPKPPLENAVWWVEYALRHGGARHLRAPAANMSWAEYYELELVLITISGIIILGALLLYTICSCINLVK